MQNHNSKLKVLTIFFFILLSLFLCNSSEAAKWFEYDNEDGVVGNSLPSKTSGPYYFEYSDPGKYQSDSIRSKYAEETGDSLGYIQIWNPLGTYGTAWSESNPITLVPGTTYYLGGFFRFEKINGNDIWHSSNDFDKLLEMVGSGFRWIFGSGFAEVVNYSVNKLTFVAGVAKSSVPSWPFYDKVPPNVSPYSSSNPPYCDYSRWYAVVMGVTAYANSNGRVRLWVNGSLTTDYSGQTMETGATISKIGMNGTIGQPVYDAPDHKRQFDRIILTDNWEDIVSGGYLSDPNGSPDTTPPAAPSGVTVN